MLTSSDESLSMAQIRSSTNALLNLTHATTTAISAAIISEGETASVLNVELGPNPGCLQVLEVHQQQAQLTTQNEEGSGAGIGPVSTRGEDDVSDADFGSNTPESGHQVMGDADDAAEDPECTLQDQSRTGASRRTTAPTVNLRDDNANNNEVASTVSSKNFFTNDQNVRPRRLGLRVAGPKPIRSSARGPKAPTKKTKNGTRKK